MQVKLYLVSRYVLWAVAASRVINKVMILAKFLLAQSEILLGSDQGEIISETP